MLAAGQKIYLLRLEKKMSQAVLAQAAGIAQPNLSAIERGGRDFTVSTLLRIAGALEVKPGSLLDSDPVKGQNPWVWSRESLDRIARALLDEKINLRKEEKHAVALLRPLLKQKLRIFSGSRLALTQNARQERRCLIEAKALLGENGFHNIIGRVEKLLALKS